MQLEIGDKICVSSRFTPEHIVTVERVTKTLAVAGAQSSSENMTASGFVFKVTRRHGLRNLPRLK